MKRDIRFGLVMTNEERIKLKVLAKSEGLSEAAIVRRLIRSATKQSPTLPRRAVTRARVHFPTPPPAAMLDRGQ